MCLRLALASAALAAIAAAAPADTYFSDLTRAAIRGEAEKVEAILYWGGNPNYQGWLGLSPLAAAMGSCSADPAVVYALLKAGADPETRSGPGATPLMLAWQMGRQDLAEMLLALGADPQARNMYGDTAAEYELFFAGQLPEAEFQTQRHAGFMPRADGSLAQCQPPHGG